jgi:DNA polymerase-3 subunit alpha
MAEMREKFVTGSMKNDVAKETAEAIFQQFEEFAAYGFNKSHAACYALIAYQTAYLKAHYPACFMAGLLNSDSSNLDRVTIEVEECRRMGMKVLPPDVNESYQGFSVVKETVDTSTPTLRFGLQAVKGLGEDVVAEIVQERKKNGPYKDLADFAKRIPGRAFNKKSLEALTKSGGLDCFGDRNQILFNTDVLLEFHKQIAQEASSGQTNLFAAPGDVTSVHTLKLKVAPPASNHDLLAWEKELLGLYVSAHPFRDISDRLGDYFTPLSKLRELKKEKRVRVGGILTDAKKIYTKNNEPMVFATLEDLSMRVEVVVFPRVYQENPDQWVADTVLCITGRPQEKDGEMKVLAENGFTITPLNLDEIERVIKEQRGGPAMDPDADGPQVPRAEKSPIILHFHAHPSAAVLKTVREICDRHPGLHPVHLKIDESTGVRVVHSDCKITFGEALVKDIELVLGPGTVKVGGA